MKRQEFWWMLLPCLLLLGAGFWLHTQESKAPLSDYGISRINAPFALHVKKIEKKVLSLQEINAGYGSKWRIHFGVEGSPPPPPARLRGWLYDYTTVEMPTSYVTERRNGKEIRINDKKLRIKGKGRNSRLPTMASTWMTRAPGEPGKRDLQNQEIQLYLLLPDFGPSNGQEIFFKATITPHHHFQPKAGIAMTNKKIPPFGSLGTPQPFSFRVQS